jgi:hypothetical protein
VTTMELDTYVGFDRHGCAIAVTVDLGDKQTARDVASFIKSGLRIERRTCAEVRAMHWGCVVKQAARKQQGVLL